jgi:hypothetical protein
MRIAKSIAERAEKKLFSRIERKNYNNVKKTEMKIFAAFAFSAVSFSVGSRKILN